MNSMPSSVILTVPVVCAGLCSTAGGAAVVLANVADDDLVADERTLQSAAVNKNVVTAAIGARKAEILRERNERRFHVFADRN